MRRNRSSKIAPGRGPQPGFLMVHMNDFERFQSKVSGGEDQSRIFPLSGSHGTSSYEVVERLTLLYLACEMLSERIAKLEERALKRKMK